MTTVTAVGFVVGYGDISSGLWLCLPLVVLKGEDPLYLAGRVDWQGNPHDLESGLTSVDEDEIEGIGVFLPIGERRAIEPGWALAVMGEEFAQTMKEAGIACSDEVSVAPMPNEAYSVGFATVESFERFRATICSNASAAFDKALGSSGGYGLSGRGRAALRVLRHLAYRRSDVAVRELAGAIGSKDLDLLRRLLTRYSIELQESRAELERKARQHITWCELVEGVRGAGRSTIDHEVVWKQSGGPISISHLERHPAGVRQVTTLSVQLIEYTIVRDNRGPNEVPKARSIKIIAYSKGQDMPWHRTVRREVNSRPSLYYTHNAVTGISEKYLLRRDDCKWDHLRNAFSI